MQKYHYVYRITNIQENKHYYGVRTSKVEPKLDLGVKYFSSSSNKEFINNQKENNQIFTYKVIKTYGSREEAVNMEIKLHNRLNVNINDSFYNKSKQTSKSWDTTGIKISEETRKRMSIASKARIMTDETKHKISNSHKGLLLSEETKRKISKTSSGENNGMYGRKHSDKSKNKMREYATGRKFKILKCLYCDTEMSENNIYKYHMNNCKNKAIL